MHEASVATRLLRALGDRSHRRFLSSPAFLSSLRSAVVPPPFACCEGPSRAPLGRHLQARVLLWPSLPCRHRDPRERAGHTVPLHGEGAPGSCQDLWDQEVKSQWRKSPGPWGCLKWPPAFLILTNVSIYGTHRLEQQSSLLRTRWREGIKLQFYLMRVIEHPHVG